MTPHEIDPDTQLTELPLTDSPFTPAPGMLPEANSGTASEGGGQDTTRNGWPHETPAPFSAARNSQPAIADSQRLDPQHTSASAKWQQIYSAWQDLRISNPQITMSAGAAMLGVPLKTLWNVLNVYAPRGFTAHRTKSGRRPDYLPSTAELACVREIYSKLDESEARGRGLGSSRIAAYRLAAKSDDPRITEQFRAVVLKPRKGKYVPPSWMRLLDTPASVIDVPRDSRTTMSKHISTPRNRTIVGPDGIEIPLRCGAIAETDDGTLNFYAHIPWPFGGDKCSDKYGVRLGRWQFLPALDVHAEMCLAFDVVARNAGSYRGEDSRAIIGRTMFDVAVPAMWRLERGAWESAIVRDALKLCQVPVFNAWHSKQKSAIERFFDRMWTPASLIPGHVGRDRARFRDVELLAQACMDGRRDPRDHFLSLEQAMPKIIKAVEFCNTEPIVSKSGWGQWVPQERWTAAAGEQGFRRLDASLKVFFSREQRVWTVRKGCIGGSVEGPQIRFPVYFQTPELWEFEGCKVRAYFDPYADPNTGTIVLEEETWRNYRRGHVIARGVPALDLPPQAVLAEDWSDDRSQRTLAMRKAISKAVRTESWSWLGQRTSRANDGLGNTAEISNLKSQVSNPAPPLRRSPFAVPPPEELSRRRTLLSAKAARAQQLRELASNES